jgi:very-short-patch-repair endonuclease
MTTAEPQSIPDWNGIRRYYSKHRSAIVSAGPNHWGIDPYQWEFEAGIKMTRIEWLFWSDIRSSGVVMYPQFPIGRYFADFANPCAHVAIECDGAAFHRDIERDAARQADIEDMGWRVFRICGSDCYRDDELTEDECGRSKFIRSPGWHLLRHICTEVHDIRVGRPLQQQRTAVL